ncbi:MAG: hypothetical protein ACFCVK_12175 [Acidimicrobiales bacterium]
MATTIQLVVAGALLVAWIWVLGRPLVSGTITRSNYADLDRTYLARPADRAGLRADDDDDDVSPQPTDGLGLRVSRWWTGWDLYARRRQMVMATMIAAFVAFFLAIAFHRAFGRLFVWLFLLMIGVMVTALLVASARGARMVAAERSRAVATAKRQVRPGTIAIRAPRAGSILEDDDRVEPLVVTGDAVLDGPYVDPAAVVNELIDSVWGEEAAVADSPGPAERVPVADPAVPEFEPAVAADAVVAETKAGPDATPGAGPLVADPVVVDPVVVDAVVVDPVMTDPMVTEPSVGAETDGPAAPAEQTTSSPGGTSSTEASAARATGAEAIFIRAAKDEPPRPKRRSRPIHIDAELDDDVPSRRAVNHP